MSMKKWRYDILIELNDCQPDVFILSNEPRIPECPPNFVYRGVQGDYIPWKRFNELVESGDIVETKRSELPVDTALDEPMTLIEYKLGPNGLAALQALPNFDRREQSRKKVTI